MTLLHRPSIQLNKSLTRLKTAFHETAQANFSSSKFDNALSTFFKQPRSTISSASEPSRILTPLHRPSTQVNKSLTRLKTAFHETAQANFSSSKFDNALSTFFKQPRSTISSASEPTRIMTLLHRPSIQLNKSLTRLKTAFHDTTQANFSSSKFGNVLSSFFRQPRSTTSSAPEPTRIMTLLHRPSIHLNKSLTRLKIAFHDTTQANFSSSKFDNVLSTFLDNLDKQLALLQNLLGL